MSGLSFQEKNRFTETLLDLYKQKLVAKVQPVLPPEGVVYDDNPANLCLLGNIGPMRDPDFEGMQPPNSIGMVLLVTPDDQQRVSCQVSGRFDICHRYIPDLDKMRSELLYDAGQPRQRQATLPCFRRYTALFEGISFDFNVQNDLSNWQHDTTLETSILPTLEDHIRQDPRVYTLCQLNANNRAVLQFDWSDAINEQNAFNAVIRRDIFAPGSDEILHYRVAVRARIRRPPHSLTNIPGSLLLEVYLVNETESPIAWQFGMGFPFLLDTTFTTSIAAGQAHLLPHKLKPEDYRHRGNDGLDGYGITCAVKKIGTNHFQTEAMPVVAQPLFETPTAAEVGMKTAPSFADLSSDPIPVLEELVIALKNYGQGWIAKIAELKQKGLFAEATVAENDARDFNAEIARVEKGISLLKRDPDLLKAFCWMNEAMMGAIKRQRKSFTGWRLFQIGFILTQLEAIYERHNPLSDESANFNHADVLWFATGGGKTEAYLGIICMAMIYQRMRGRSYGVTAWLRFPLRMLSVQQFQRLSYVIAQANIMRQERGLSGHPFTIGYFTGGGTPGRISHTGESYRKFFLPSMSSDALEALKFISDCPYCDAEHSVEIQKDLPSFRIKHVCNNPECWSNTISSTGVYGEGINGELGIYVSDEECYRYLPSVLVGTIDKLAVIAHNTRFKKFFGAAGHFCPVHGFTETTVCEHKRYRRLPSGEDGTDNCGNNTRTSAVQVVPVPPLIDPGFSFCIQDELHLLKETLGNFDGHYETLLQTLQVLHGGLPSKILAATATIKDYATHIHHLYQKHAIRYPSPGIQQGESFYSRQQRGPNGIPLIRRYFASFLPVGQRNPDVRGTSIASSQCLDLIDELRTLFSNDPALGASLFNLSVAQIPDALIYLEEQINTNLMYVNRKRAISEISRFLEEANMQRGTDREWVRLDGESTLEEIQEAIDHIEQKQPNDQRRQMIATSLVSHGVDIERLNFMVLAGWPASTAEYIQASARAGRVHPGVVITIFSYLKLYEYNVFLNFTDYHTFLDKLVESVPINRFAPNVLERTLPGIISAVILNWAACQPWGNRIKFSIREVHRILNDPANPARGQIEDAVINSLSVDPSHIRLWFDSRVVNEFQQQVKQEIQRGLRRLETWTGGMDMSLTDVLGRIYTYKPLRSFRDIENQISIDSVSSGHRENVLDALGR